MTRDDGKRPWKRPWLGDPPAWYKIAAAARSQVEAIPHGRREQDTRELAKHHGLGSADSLRRYIVAANFADRLFQDHPAARRFPQALPIAAVELISRWYQYDAPAALKAADHLARGEYTVAALRSDERAARRASQTMRTGRAGAHWFRERLRPKIDDLVQLGAVEQYVPDLPRPFEPKQVDFLYRALQNAADRVAFALFGPYVEQRNYLYHEEAFLVRLLGLAAVYGKVAGIVPVREAWGVNFEEWRMHYNRDGLSISFHYVDVTTFKIHSPHSIHGE